MIAGEQRRAFGPWARLALLLTAAHFGAALCFFAPAISTPDANSYYTQARLIAENGRTWMNTGSRAQYVGTHWKATPGGRYYCTHAPGLAAVLALPYRLFGTGGALLLSALLCSLSLLGLFLICRIFMSEPWALLGAGLMAVNPMANEHAFFGDAHAAAVFFLGASLFALLRWAATRSLRWAAAAGLLAGMGPAIRYPEAVLLPPLALFMVLHRERGKEFGRSLLAAGAGAAVPLAAVALRNQSAYGAFWRTGYALTGEQSAFGLEHLAAHAFPFLEKLMSEGCFLLFPLGVAGIAALCADRRRWKVGALAAMLAATITLLYMSYYTPPDPQSMRYLLPTFYVYAAAGVWLLSRLDRKHPLRVRAGCVLLVLGMGLWGLPQSFLKVRMLTSRNAALAQVTRELEAHVPAGRILVSPQGLNQHLDAIGRWRLADAGVLRPEVPPPLPPGPGPYAGPGSARPAPRSVYGSAGGSELWSLFSRDLRSWAGPEGGVYMVADDGLRAALARLLPPDEKLILVARIRLPRLPPLPPPPPPIPGVLAVPPHAQGGGPGPYRVFDLDLDGGELDILRWEI